MKNNQTRRPQAREDILSIWRYIATDNETAATTLIRRIDGAIDVLAENPFVGRERGLLGKQIRSFPVGSYTIFYISTGDNVDIA